MASSQRDQQREAVRLLAIQFGVREAARRCNLSEDRVRQWSCRYKWLESSTPSQQLATVTTVTKPGDILLDELAEHEHETRISLARSARRMAKDCEELPVKHADKALTVAKTMAIVHRQDEGKRQGFSLNVLNVGSFGIEIKEK